jgi:hypothetical protein
MRALLIPLVSDVNATAKLSLRDAENISTVGITFDFVLSSVAHIPSHTVSCAMLFEVINH